MRYHYGSCSHRVGVLDIGSNSVRLLVADLTDRRVFCVHTQRIPTRLISGMKDGVLDGEAIERTAAAVEVLAGKARELNAREVVGFGTSAMRDGVNNNVLIERAARSGVAIEVISGAMEAELAYAGAAPRGRRGVLDIGGGSTELLTGVDGRVSYAHSAQVGAVRLKASMPETGGADALVRAARAALEDAWRAVAAQPVDGWMGVGGTLTTLAAMCLKMRVYDSARVEGYRLKQADARTWLNTLYDMEPDARARVPGLAPDRVDIIPYGAAILCAFFELSGAQGITVTDRDNLPGYLKLRYLR